MSHIEDRWFRTIAGANGKPVKEPRSRNGIGLRYRVRYEDPDGGEHSRSFTKKADADAFKTRIDNDLLREATATRTPGGSPYGSTGKSGSPRRHSMS